MRKEAQVKRDIVSNNGVGSQEGCEFRSYGGERRGSIDLRLRDATEELDVVRQGAVRVDQGVEGVDNLVVLELDRRYLDDLIAFGIEPRGLQV